MKGLTFINEVRCRRSMLRQLVVRNLKIRYKASVLGFLWTLINPVLMAAIYGLFMGLVARVAALDEIFIGVFVWQFTMTCIGDGIHLVLGNGNLIRKVYFPRMILPLATAAANLVNFCLMFGVLMFILVLRQPGVVGPRLVQHLPHLAGLIGLQALLCLGVICIVATANVYFRDTEHLVGIFTTAWFFLSPVMYPVTLVREQWPQFLGPYLANPMAGLLYGYRRALLLTPPALCGPLLGWWALSLAVAAGIGVAGVALFQRRQREFADLV